MGAQVPSTAARGAGMRRALHDEREPGAMGRGLFCSLGVWAVAVLLVLVLGSGRAVAQDKKPKGKDTASADEEKPKVKVERGAGGKKIYRITTGFVIEGRIQKPNAFYVLERSQINYDWVALKKHFLPKILEATRRSPF
jgi:hypothetical protein